MTIETFNAALLHDAPPAGWSPALQALWHQGKGDWDRAHRLAQAQDDAEGAWLHAHLHRAEGDVTNRQARRALWQASLNLLGIETFA